MRQPVISLFDESGIMVRPWAERGFKCYCFDILNDDRIERFPSGGSIMYVKADLMPDDWRVEGSTSATIERIIEMDPYIVFGFGPCDDLACCGAKHFAKKLAADPDCQLRAVALWRVVETIGQRTGAPWFGENPRSRLSTLYRKRDYTFDPQDFGGYLIGEGIHPTYPDIIPPFDAYPKETWIWHGNGFAIPPRRSVPGIGYFHGWAHLGGKSAKTKRIRSSTPRGWANAVFYANWTLKQFA